MSRLRRWMPCLAPTTIGAAFAFRGHHERAAALLIVAAVVALQVWRGVDVAGAISRGASRAGTGLAKFLGWLAFGLIVLPAWAWTRLRRQHPLDHGPRAAWSPVAGTDNAPTAMGSATPGLAERRPLWRSIAWCLEVVFLIAAVNYGAGWTYDRVSGRTGPDSVAEALGSPMAGIITDPRIDSPAMAAYPWRSDYFADLQRTEGGYWPFTEFRPEPFSSPYINLEDWTRRSYQAPGPVGTRPLVWMFGGSTTFGEGQRDEQTIASWLVRLSEAESVPIQVANYGQRGWTHFQEMILFEQRLALDSPPDVAIFYDGANEITAQALLNEAVPSNTLVLQFAERLTGATVATQFLQQDPTPFPLSDQLWHAYSQHSLAHKLVRAFAPTVAGAQESDRNDLINTGAATAGEGTSTDYTLTVQDGIDAGQVYERGKRITQGIADAQGIPTFFFWQPLRSVGEPQERATAELSASTIDISDALDDHRPVYIDGGHTNEEGARLVAEAIWEHLAPEVERWYDREG